jgi:predicted ATPase
MLSRIYIDNYKCLVNFTLELGGLTILHGDNGSGKSTVFEALRSIQRLAQGGCDIASTFPVTSRTRWQPERDIQAFELQCNIDKAHYRYTIAIQHHIDKRLSRLYKEELRYDGALLLLFNEGEVHLYRDDHSEGPKYPFNWTRSALGTILPQADNTKLTAFKRYLENSVFCSPDPHRMEHETNSEDEVLHFNASNFASWYRSHTLERPDRVNSLVNALTEVLPGFEILRLEKTGADARTLFARFLSSESSASPVEYRFDELSDGERMLILLYSLTTFSAGGGGTIFIDEPDNYISLPELYPWLTALNEQCEEHGQQALIISHHPEFYDFRGGRRGVWLKREANGPTRVIEPQYPAEDDKQGLKLSELVARRWIE